MKSIFFDQARYADEAAALASLEAPSGADIIGLDLSSPAEGLGVLLASRRAGTATAVFPLLADPLERTYSIIGQSIANNANEDQQRQQIAALATDQLVINGRKPLEVSAVGKAQVDAASLALRLASVILIAAPGERERWQSLIGRPIRRFGLLPVPPILPLIQSDEFGVTLYAPLTDEAHLAHYVMLLRKRGIEPRVISAQNPGDEITTRIVVAPEWRPMQARMLAARGHRLVGPNQTRVDECDSRIIGYSPSNYASFCSAVDAASSGSGGSQRIEVTNASVRNAIAAEQAKMLDGPLVSIIIRTYDRPALLRHAIESVAAQTYRNVEIVVVNNGGADVEDIARNAAGARPYRYEVMPERKHISAASNAGARAASGSYVGYLDDDDILYADHCARTVETLERTKADVAFTLCVGEYAQMDGAVKNVLGYQIYIDRDFNLDELYVSNFTPIHSIVHRRDAFERFGYFDEALPVTDDWELWLRMASKGATFIRIDYATCEYSWRYDPQRGNMTVNHQWDFVHAYKAITERYASNTCNRGDIIAAQASLLAQQEQRARAAEDPAKRATIVIGSMSPSLVPVASAVESLMSAL